MRPVRRRLTVLATALVTAALLLAGVVMVLVLHYVLLSSADTANSARATEIAAALAEQGPDPLDPALLNADQTIDLVQVLDERGAVVRSSRAHPGTGLGGPLAPGQREVVDGARAQPTDAEYRATRIGIRDVTGRDVVVEVGTAEAGLNRLVVLLAALCVAVFPLIVAAMAVLTHVFVGRALLPVEHLRQQVDAISDADLSDRVPVPETGDELATLAVTMNAMLARLEDAQTAQRRFVGDASHELNSPLTAIYGLLDLADHTATPVDVETVRTLLLPEAIRMRALVADLALLTRADEGALPVRRDAVSVADLVLDEAHRLRSTTALVVRVDTVPATVEGDAGQLVRVIRNLTDNATRYANRQLTLTVSRADTIVTVSVADDGPGIPVAERERVFERFTRLDSARTRASGGSGLGLAIVAEMVAAHGGAVGADGAPGGGARLWFSLPLAQSDSRRP